MPPPTRSTAKGGRKSIAIDLWRQLLRIWSVARKPACPLASDSCRWVLLKGGFDWSHTWPFTWHTKSDKDIILLQAMLWKQWLLKKRGWPTTLVEIFSPVIMLSVLVSIFPEKIALPVAVTKWCPFLCSLLPVSLSWTSKLTSYNTDAKHFALLTKCSGSAPECRY